MIDRFEATLGVGALPDGFEEIYAAACAEYAEKGAFFLQEPWLRRLQAEYNAFPRVEKPLLSAAAELRADGEAALYALFVWRAMEHRALFRAELPRFTFPKSHPFLAFFCLLPAIPAMVAELRARKLPGDVIAQTVGQFEDCVFLYEKRFDHLGLSKRYFDHMQLYVDGEQLNIGRLRFQRTRLHDPVYLLKHRGTGENILLFGAGELRADGLYADTPPRSAEGGFSAVFREESGAYFGTPVGTDGKCERTPARFPKSAYRLVLRPGDDCISVHIPDKGALTHEACEASYRRADELFRRYYPEFAPRAFHCHSWMLAPELVEMLKSGSHVLDFQRRYLRYPVQTAGEDVMNFVFNLRFTSLADLPEDTSLQRALKRRYLAGGYLYEYGGVFTVKYGLKAKKNGLKFKEADLSAVI